MSEKIPTVAGARIVEFKGKYSAKNLTPVRRGADDHLKIPSLIGGKRVYRKDANAQTL